MLIAPAFLLLTTSAQEPAPPRAPEPPPPQWSTSLSAWYWDPPHEDGYLSAVLTADRGRLHLEAHWGYEARDTGALFVGWSFPWEGAVQGSVTPRIGYAAGDTDGVVPAFALDVGWKELRFTTDVEYLIGTSSGSDDFLYSWSELTWSPSPRFAVGLVGQRTNVFDQEVTADRGFLVSVGAGPASFTLYVFNPDLDDPYVMIGAGAGF